MKITFLPGQWQVADCISNSERYLAVWKDQDKVICLVSPKGKETEEDVAHAKLIAAAPRMLDALEFCKFVLTNRDILTDGFLQHALFKVEKAIKATE